MRALLSARWLVIGALAVALAAGGWATFAHAHGALERQAVQATAMANLRDRGVMVVRLWHTVQVGHRMRAAALEQQAEDQFTRARAEVATRAATSQVRAERAALLARVAQATADGQAALDGNRSASATSRAALQEALDDLASAGPVVATVEDALGAVSAAVDAVAASHRANRARPAAAPAASSGGGSVVEVAMAELARLNGGSAVTVVWDPPELNGHLGGVPIGSSTMYLNSARLAGRASLTRDVVRHEMGHIYQMWLLGSYGITWRDLGALLEPAFGSPSQERSADCVARRLGASWTHYTTSCGNADQQAWVDAIIGGYLP